VYGSFSSKQSATSKLNELNSEVMKVKPTGITIVKDEPTFGNSSEIRYIVSSASSPKAYKYCILKLVINKPSESPDTWVVNLMIYSEEQE
jgi:hypothetical protein